MDAHNDQSIFVSFRRGVYTGDGTIPSIALVLLYTIIGTAVYSNVESRDCDDGSGECKWSIVDSVYFCTVTMSTVGYGDLSPSKATTRAFTMLWIIVGIVFVFSAVASIVGKIIRPISKKGREIMERLFPRTGVDIDGNGQIDYYVPRHWLLYYGKNLLPLFIVFGALQCACAGVFLCFEGWTYGESLYHCLVTATTVGYGDMSISSDVGKWWAVIHIILSVSLLGDLIASIDELRDERRELLMTVSQLTRKFDKYLLDRLMKTSKDLRPDLVRDGEGLTELEFVLSMLIELEVVNYDKVKPYIKQFRNFDMDGSGRLGDDDLQMLIRGDERNDANMDVAVRMGPSHISLTNLRLLLD